MLTKQYLETVDFSTLCMIAADHFGLELDKYEDDGFALDSEKLSNEILAKQQEIVSALPPGVFEEAKRTSDELQELVGIITRESESKVIAIKELFSHGVSLIRKSHPYYGWKILLLVGEEHEKE